MLYCVFYFQALSSDMSSSKIFIGLLVIILIYGYNNYQNSKVDKELLAQEIKLLKQKSDEQKLTINKQKK